MSNNREKGKEAENKAVEFLKKDGYQIIERNLTAPCGEIDVIALKNGFYVFFEIKSRKSDKFGLPQESVTFFKQQRIRKSALYYLQKNKALEAKCRFDVIAIIGENITHIEDAF